LRRNTEAAEQENQPYRNKFFETSRVARNGFRDRRGGAGKTICEWEEKTVDFVEKLVEGVRWLFVRRARRKALRRRCRYLYSSKRR
jgi:hypothetical protein